MPHDDDHVRASLAAWGAPLAVQRAEAKMSVSDTFPAALELARRDATVLRALPVFVATNMAFSRCY